MQKNYFAAFLVAIVLFAGLLGYAKYLKHSVLMDFRQSLREAKEKGELPLTLRRLDIDQVTLEDFDVELSESATRSYDIAEVIENFWYVWLVLLTLISFGVASRFQSDSQ